MKRGDVDHHMFDTIIDWPVLPPSCTLHITDNSLAVFFCGGSLQHRRQLSVIVGNRLNIAQKGINAVVTYFLHNSPYGIMVRAVDVNIKKFPINGDSPERVLLIDIQMVEYTMGLNKTVAQAQTIAQTSTRQAVFQPGSHLRKGIFMVVKVELAHVLQVFFYIVDKKRLLTEAHRADLS